MSYLERKKTHTSHKEEQENRFLFDNVRAWLFLSKHSGIDSRFVWISTRGG